jgi:L-cysteine S-thiosulfotransferase
MKPSMRLYAWLAPLLAGAVVLGWLGSEGTAQEPRPPAWQSRAIPEARGDIQEVDGKRVQVRYKAAPFTGVTGNFEKWPTYAHADTKTYPPRSQVPMPAMAGDPKEGRKLFMDRAKGPCTGCHLIQGDDVWPAGSIGPDLSTFGDQSLPD